MKTRYPSKLARRIMRANGIGRIYRTRRRFHLALRKEVAKAIAARRAASSRKTGAQKRRERRAAG